GLDVDARSDIWSLGVVLFEMITGRRPFEGPTSSDLIVAILERSPVQLSECVESPPQELERIIGKCLAKPPDGRYPTIAEFLEDLQALNLNGAAGVATERQLHRVTKHSANAAAEGGSRPAVTASVAVRKAAGILGRQRTILALLLISAIVVAGTLLAWKRLSKRPAASESHQFDSIGRLTTSGKVPEAVISPDGRYLAYVVGSTNDRTLFVRKLTGDSLSETEVARSSSGVEGLTFSPSGNVLYYLAGDSGDTLYRAAIEEDVAEAVIGNVNSAVSWSPDGSRIAFVRSSENQSQIVLADAAGGGERILDVREQPTRFTSPSWSPDGNLIAVAIHNEDENGTHRSLVAVRVSDGVEQAIGSNPWPWIDKLTWVPDGGALIICAKEAKAMQYRIYRVAYPGGESTQVTTDLADYHGISITADGSRLVSVQREDMLSLFVADPATGQERMILSERGRIYSGLSWTADDRIVWTSTERGNADIVAVAPARGSVRTHLTADPATDYDADVSRDGKYLFWVSDRSGSYNIWRMRPDGTEPAQVTFGAYYSPECSSDDTVIVTSRAGPATLWKVRLGGGPAVPLELGESRYGVESPDGRFILCQHKERPDAKWKVAVFSVEDSTKQPRLFDIQVLEAIVKWAPRAGSLLTYVETKNELFSIWERPLNGGSRRQLTREYPEEIYDFAWRRDGGRLAYIRGTRIENAVILNSSALSKEIAP
ncbi:MAG TPA: protein kinase, partial [Blastocatellia bacterium]|nr:protein kinase [Blastocatellia bacterium]